MGWFLKLSKPEIICFWLGVVPHYYCNSSSRRDLYFCHQSDGKRWSFDYQSFIYVSLYWNTFFSISWGNLKLFSFLTNYLKSTSATISLLFRSITEHAHPQGDHVGLKLEHTIPWLWHLLILWKHTPLFITSKFAFCSTRI